MHKCNVHIVLALFIGLILSACKPKSDGIEHLGNIDKEAIAADTTTQVIIDNSFEYVKDLDFKDRRFTVLTGGYVEFKQVVVVETKANNSIDTLYHLSPDSVTRIVDAFITDLDANKSPELHLIFKHIPSNAVSDSVVLNYSGRWTKATFETNKKVVGVEWAVKDGFLVEKGNLLNNTKDTVQGYEWLYFKLKNNNFKPEKAEAVL